MQCTDGVAIGHSLENMRILNGHLAMLVTWLILPVTRRGNNEVMLIWVLYFEAR